MQFKIVGARKDTGEDVEITLEAQDVDEAHLVANHRGILVASCAAIARPAKPIAVKVAAAPVPARDAVSLDDGEIPLAAPPKVAGKTCPECHKRVVVGAVDCPHCGYPFTDEPVPMASQVGNGCRLKITVDVGKIGKLYWLANQDDGTIELGGQTIHGPVKAGFTCEFNLPTGEHLLKTHMVQCDGKYRVILPEPGEYELTLGINQWFGTLLLKPKLKVKKIS